jgi:hypothetical protein
MDSFLEGFDALGEARMKRFVVFFFRRTQELEKHAYIWFSVFGVMAFVCFDFGRRRQRMIWRRREGELWVVWYLYRNLRLGPVL